MDELLRDRPGTMSLDSRPCDAGRGSGWETSAAGPRDGDADRAMLPKLALRGDDGDEEGPASDPNMLNGFGISAGDFKTCCAQWVENVDG